MIRILFLALLMPSVLEAQIWQWGRYGGGADVDRALRVAVARDGDALVLVTYGGSARFDGVNLATIGGRGVAVVRYSPGGAIRWGASNGGSGDVHPVGIAVDRGGSSYVVGSFTRTVSFGAHVLASRGDRDIFVAKLSPAGTWLWARSAGGSTDDVPGGVAVDSLDRPVVAGWFVQGARFDTIDIGSAGGSDLFIAKYETTGQLVWVMRDGGSGDERALGVSVDASGAIAIVGEFDGSGTFGGRDLGTSAYTDIAVARYSRDGTPLWGRRVGSDSLDRAGAIAADPFGRITITGSYSGALDLGTTQLPDRDGSRLLLVRMDALGEVRWGMGSTGGVADGVDVAVDPNGTVAIVADFATTIEVGDVRLTTSGDGDVGIIWFGADGAPLHGDHDGGVGVTRGGGVAFDSRGELYVCGSYSHTARFGSVVLPAPSMSDAFIVRYGADAAVMPGAVQPGPYCPGAVVDLPYALQGGFLSGNVFVVEISDSSGSFARPIEVGRVSTTLAGTIACTFPLSMPAGAAYRLRITASNPPRVSTASDSFELAAVPIPVVFTGDTLFLCAGETTTLDAGGGYISYVWSTGASSRTISVSQTGTYSVLVTNEAGCSGSSDSVTVFVHPPVSKPTITKLTPYLLESSLADYFQWYRNGDPIPAATRRTHFVTEGGNYTVRVSYENGCSALSDPLAILVADAAGDRETHAVVSIYPMPVRDGMWVHAPIEVGDHWRVRILSLDGRECQASSGYCVRRGDVGWVRRGHLPPGTYVLEVTTQHGRCVQRLVAE